MDDVLSAVGNSSKHHKRSKRLRRGRKACAEADSRDAAVPAGQIAPQSYLKLAIDKSKPDLQNLFSSDSSSSDSSSLSDSSASSDTSSGSSSSKPSDSSDGSSSSAENSSSSGLSSATDRKRQKHRKYKVKKWSQKPAWKPVPPVNYNGDPDPEVFHCFVRQTTELINGYDISPDMVFSTGATYLSGRAYDFYANTVAENPHKWTNLWTFFIGLFNYCFPMDFWLQVCAKLEKYQQYEHSIRDYSHGLQSLMRLAGNSVKNWESIIQFWNSLNMSIQESLWDHKLLPLVSTWDEILQEAEFVEASHRVKKEMRDKHQPKNNGSNSTSLSHNRNKHSGNNNHHQRQPSAPRGPSLNKREPSSAAPQWYCQEYLQ